jgi:hypothetical protein
MRTPLDRCAAVSVYLLGIAGICLLTVKLSSVMAVQAIALTQPYFLDHCPCMPSIIEQRRIAQFAAPSMTERLKERVAVLEAPSLSVEVLAAQMDLAEQADRASTTASALSPRTPR